MKSDLEKTDGALSTAIALDIRSEVENVKKRFDERLSAVESRLVPIEGVIAKVPSLEAHLGRVDAMLLNMQGDIRRMEKSSNESATAITAKLDDIRSLIVTVLKK